MRRTRLAIAALGAALGATGCTTHDCDPSAGDGGAGRVFAQGQGLVWESAPATGPWLAFPGSASVTFTFPPGFRCGDGCVLNPSISTDAYQGPEAGTFVVGTGYITSFSNQTPEGFTVTNGACAFYYLRVTATAPLAVSDAGGEGGGDGGVFGPD